MANNFKPLLKMTAFSKRGNKKGHYCKCGSFHPASVEYCPRWSKKIVKKYIIGIDPDSNKHGVAVFKDGKLSVLQCMTLIELQSYVVSLLVDVADYDIAFHIEDVSANYAVFRKGQNIRDSMSIARRLGMVQQSQSELERMINAHNIKIVHHKISKLWKQDKKQFELVTGWTGRSNEDTRSAAYFAWLGAKYFKI